MAEFEDPKYPHWCKKFVESTRGDEQVQREFIDQTAMDGDLLGQLDIIIAVGQTIKGKYGAHPSLTQGYYRLYPPMREFLEECFGAQLESDPEQQVVKFDSAYANLDAKITPFLQDR